MNTPEQKQFKVIIIDDEADARELLFSLISEHPEIQIAAEASSAVEALPLIIKHQPDLLFLDVQMPHKTGFDLISELRELQIDIPLVFVTAFNEYAIQAIKASALDYLMKPVDPLELTKAIQKFRNQEIKNHYQEKVQVLLNKIFPTTNAVSKVRFNNRSGYILINPDDILYLEAETNYTHIYLKGSKKETISSNLGSVEKLLPDQLFQRISRSVVINTSHLTRVDRSASTCILEADGNIITLKATSFGKEVWE
ncbi:MAG: LytTR family DNA-binding domain-containing protein [Bacteroidetes bacterium]|nr:LytTR family DNA-binding domain-containing protein [Bacteroidota bacterium]